MIDTNVKNVRLKLDRDTQKQTMNWYEEATAGKHAKLHFIIVSSRIQGIYRHSGQTGILYHPGNH